MATSAPSCWLGIDLGTSSCKAVLVEKEGATTVASAVASYPLDRPTPLAAEQDPAAWWAAAVEVVRAVRAQAPDREVAGIGLTGQKHALLALDGRNRPLGPAVLWCDGRAADEAARLAEEVPDLGRRTGAPALPGYLVPKWRRFRRERPEQAARVVRLCFAKDWIRLRLSGTFATDRTEASSAQVQDRRRPDAWDATLCRELGVEAHLLPRIHRSTATAGLVSRAAAATTGLEAGTPIVGGAGDNEAAAVSCGALMPGRVAVILGTSGTVVAAARRRGPAGGLVWGCHVTAREVAATGTILSAGRALTWIRDLAWPRGTEVQEIVEEAFGLEEDASRPLFLPSLAGERSPVPDAGARGAFADLEIDHTRAHLALAVLEGVAIAVGEVVALLRRARIEVNELRLTSRGAASAAWGALIAAAADAPVRIVGEAEGPARGAAALAAGRGLSAARLRALAEAFARPGPRLDPDPGEVRRLAGARRRLGILRRTLHPHREGAA